ncbi:putative transcriptional regulator [Streptomyces sp. NBRC 110611]|uniref:transcriptional regulator n=1 Tax=Streptomyces sp. NBRC 110611 TaxID=1621259 RepID=UPI00083535CD|nr:transcriptional regulator [Streptomyces sp. NBRC 110611]GAU67185.1 putative transcriptional regulator [Streptomyces sp. NBRC 110611]
MTRIPAPRRGDGALPRRFGQRLNQLISALYPDGYTRPGYARLAREVREATGGTISGTYLWELATGKKSNVTLDQLDVLAEFFGVPPEYFLHDEVADRVGSELAPAGEPRDAKVRNLALRAEGLSAANLDALLIMVDEARRVQGLSSVGDAAMTPGPKGDAAEHG